MSGFNGMLPVSFLDLEVCLFNRLSEVFRAALSLVLGMLDDTLFEVRDRERYRMDEIAATRIETLFGTVEFKRRVYEDKQTGERVYALDEALGLRKRARVSPGLRQMAVLQAVDASSYRGARDNLKQFYGHQALSHEAIRQCVLKAGALIEAEARRAREMPEGKRKVKVLFIEADGIMVSRQRVGKREARLAISYEGWRRRQGSRDEYELLNAMHFHAHGVGDDFWEEVSRELWSKYDLRDTMVVINGDRARWIRQALEYFPKAIYQIDRFHLKRDLKVLLAEVPDAYRAVMRGLEEGQAERVLEILKVVRLRKPGAMKALSDLVADLEQQPEAMLDYRMRLGALGYDTAGLRGMGAAEPTVNKYSRRLKKQGRSWGDVGLGAMMGVMGKRFEGVLGRFTKHLDRAFDEIKAVTIGGRLTDGASRVVREVVSEITGRMSARMPILAAGRTASGGLSWFFQRLNDALPADLL